MTKTKSLLISLSSRTPLVSSDWFSWCCIEATFFSTYWNLYWWRFSISKKSHSKSHSSQILPRIESLDFGLSITASKKFLPILRYSVLPNSSRFDFVKTMKRILRLFQQNWRIETYFIKFTDISGSVRRQTLTHRRFKTAIETLKCTKTLPARCTILGTS